MVRVLRIWSLIFARRAGLTTGTALSAIAWLGGCERSTVDSRNEVVLYVSADDHVADPIIAQFEAESGVSVRKLGDTEATKNTGLVQRLRVESGRPVADVFWSSEVFLTIELSRDGLLTPHQTTTTEQWPEEMTGQSKLWHGFGQRARVLVYNTDRLEADAAPATLHDMLDEAYRNRIVIARPAFGTTRGHMAALVAMWGEDETRAWMRSLNALGVRLVDGNSAVVRAVAHGEADIGLTDTDDVWGGKRNGWPIEMVFVRHDLPGAIGADRHGVLLIPNTVALIRNGPNPEQGAEFVDFLLSEATERALAQSDSHNIPVRPSLLADYAWPIPEDAATISFEAVVEAMPDAMRLCHEELGG